MRSTRRRLLCGAAAGIASSALAAPALVAQRGATRITFAFGPDPSGAVRSLIDGFNAANPHGIEVAWRMMPEDSAAFFRALAPILESRPGEIDLFGCDVVWTAEMASRGLARDLSAWLGADLDPGAMLQAPLDCAFADGRFWAVPWFTDAGVLFYRRDLLERAGLEDPPRTWEALAAAVRRVRAAGGPAPAHGLVFEGVPGEGGVAGALEFVWSAGGRIWVPRGAEADVHGMTAAGDAVVALDSTASAAGLTKARELVERGIVPDAVTGWSASAALADFASGRAVFLRSWIHAHAMLGRGGGGAVTPDRVGVARLPTLRSDLASFGCMGGWNLALAEGSKQAEAAWAFVRWALERDCQRAMARQGGYLPVISDLYHDGAPGGRMAVLSLGREAVATARGRPVSPIYSRLSPRIAALFTGVLAGEAPAREAVRRTARELRRIVSDSRPPVQVDDREP